MTTYTSKPELLERGDKVIFTIKGKSYEYLVQSSFLSIISSHGNNYIFQVLNVDKYDFCDKHYGYRSIRLSWPECKSNDHEALTRVVNALFDEINKQYSPLPDSLFDLEI